jgi:aminoglycoside 6'-N-acetyltransferase
VTGFAVEEGARVIGLIQYYEEDDPEYRHAGIDLFLTSDRQGRGLGRDAVRTLALHLVRDRGHHRLVIDPAAENERAIRCYEAVGFKRVGVLRQHWRAPDGTWRDGVLFDLLADEI